MSIKNIISLSPSRRAALISLFILIPSGFGMKFYSGPGGLWFNNYAAGVLYEIFWCIFFFLISPRTKPVKIAVCVLVITSLLEILQLWHPPFLQAIRTTFAGAALLGTTFVWWDFPYYVLGVFLAWLWMRKFAPPEPTNRA